MAPFDADKYQMNIFLPPDSDGRLTRGEVGDVPQRDTLIVHNPLEYNE